MEGGGLELRFDDIGTFKHSTSVSYFLQPEQSVQLELRKVHARVIDALPPPPGGSWKDQGKGKGKHKGKGKGKDMGKYFGKAKSALGIEAEDLDDEEMEAEATDDVFIPHLTVAKKPVMDNSFIEKLKHELFKDGPICFWVSSVSLCERGDNTPFQEQASLLLEKI